MAVAYVASVLGTSSSGSTTAVVNLTTRSVGDLGFILISRSNTNYPSTVPTGWTGLDDMNATYRTQLYWKVLESGDLISNLTFSGYTSSVRTLMTAHFFSGFDTSDPLDTNTHGTTTFNTTANAYIDFGSLNTSAPFIAAFATDYSTTVRSVSTQPSGLTERYDYSNATPDYGHYCGTQTWAGGTYAPSASTSYLSGNATYKVGFLVGINAATSTMVPLDPMGRMGFFGV